MNLHALIFTGHLLVHFIEINDQFKINLNKYLMMYLEGKKSISQPKLLKLGYFRSKGNSKIGTRKIAIKIKLL